MIKFNKIYTIGSLLLLVVISGCKKETLRETKDDIRDKLTVQDNQNDPVDAAIYQFYKETGVPVFYNDTISKKHVSDTSGVPVYAYTKLMTTYSVSNSGGKLYFKLTRKRQLIPSMLSIIKTDLLPKLSASCPLNSLLIVDSINGGGSSARYPTVNTPYVGFNTVLVKAFDGDTTTASSRKKIVSGILAELVVRKLMTDYSSKIEEGFNSVSKQTVPDGQIYIQFLVTLPPDGTRELEDFGFINYLPIDFLQVTTMPQNDLFDFVEAVFLYDKTTDFEAKYANYPLVLKKYKFVLDMLKSLGFKIS